MEMNVDRMQIMRILREASPVTIMINQTQLGSMLTNDGRCTCEITSRVTMAKAAFNKKKTLFTS
jgi:hypothetical protein